MSDTIRSQAGELNVVVGIGRPLTLLLEFTSKTGDPLPVDATTVNAVITRGRPESDETLTAEQGASPHVVAIHFPGQDTPPPGRRAYRWHIDVLGVRWITGAWFVTVDPSDLPVDVNATVVVDASTATVTVEIADVTSRELLFVTLLDFLATLEVDGSLTANTTIDGDLTAALTLEGAA